MQSATELTLPHLPVEDPAFQRDPASYFSQARSQHPWLATTTYGYMVTDYAAVRDLHGMDAKMRPPHEVIIAAMNAEGSRWARFQLDSLMAGTGETHRRIRDGVAPLFTPRAANQHRELMRKTIGGLLDEWAPKGAFDFELFASYFPITVMCRTVGGGG